MTQTNISVAGLESYQPAVDYRKSGRVGVLSGTNFAWDAAGVYSAYASRLVSGSDSITTSPYIVQHLDLETAINIVSLGDVSEFVPSSPGSPVGSWNQFLTIPPLVYVDPDDVPYNLTRWSSAYLGGQRYACCYNYGVFRVDVDFVPDPQYTRLTQFTTPGFPDDTDPVIAICETNGRMIYVTHLVFYWSAQNAPENLVPALGGAGFQVIAERIAGVPFAVTSVANGCIIWTSTGALVCEFIGGDSVFRFWEMETAALPISSYSIAQLPDNNYVLLTRLGLYQFDNLSQPQPITPLFNEFLREYLRQKPNDFGHLWYSITENRLYVSSRTQSQSFPITYGLDIVIDRWGVFSTPHLGIFLYGIDRGQVAYAGQFGRVSFLLSPTDSRKNRENPDAPGTFIGLASTILIGWMRPENYVVTADVVPELQQIVVNRLTPLDETQLLYTDEGFVIGGTVVNVDEGFIVSGGPFTIIDEGLITSGEEAIDYRLVALSDLFTFSDGSNRMVPFLVRQSLQLDLWVTTMPTAYIRLQFIATEPDEFYRVNSLDLTVAFDGKQG